MQNNFDWSYFPNFKPEEFTCPCCGLGKDLMDSAVLAVLQAVRNNYGPTTISVGFRCKKYNDSLPGSDANSYHMRGKAADFYVSKCATEAGRKEVMAFVKRQPGVKYVYCNIGGNHPNMGHYIHVEVK